MIGQTYWPDESLSKYTQIYKVYKQIKGKRKSEY